MWLLVRNGDEGPRTVGIDEDDLWWHFDVCVTRHTRASLRPLR